MWGPLIKRWLHELLPDDAATICSGRVGLFSLAIWPPLPQRVYVSDFESKEDLIEAAMASVHIPYFLDGRMTCVRARARGFRVLTRACSRRFRGKRCIDGSVAARRDVVDTRRKQPVADAPPTLLIDHNADPEIANSRKFGDFVVRPAWPQPQFAAANVAPPQELATREGLQRMVDAGYAYTRGQLDAGRLDALIAAAPR